VCSASTATMVESHCHRLAGVAVLANPASAATTEATLREVEPAARSMGLQIQVFNANTSREIDAAFEGMGRERADALLPYFESPTARRSFEDSGKTLSTSHSWLHGHSSARLWRAV
jgi:hypothetical protein